MPDMKPLSNKSYQLARQHSRLRSDRKLPSSVRDQIAEFCRIWKCEAAISHMIGRAEEYAGKHLRLKSQSVEILNSTLAVWLQAWIQGTRSMTMDDGYQSHFGCDPRDSKTRLRSWMHAKGIGLNQLKALGFATSELRDVFSDGTDGMDRNAATVQRICAATGCDYGYVLSGVIPPSLHKIEKARLEVYELCERFCEGLELARDEARRFISYAMHLLEPRIGSVEFALYDSGMPKCIEDVARLYEEWKRKSGS